MSKYLNESNRQLFASFDLKAVNQMLIINTHVPKPTTCQTN